MARKKESKPPKFKRSGREKSMSPKQIRARARRNGTLTKVELEALYKPLDEWDYEELAHGRPRSKDGTFRGATPAFVTRELHEEALARFKTMLKNDMRAHSTQALCTIVDMITDDSEDEKGRPMVPASVKLQASIFLIEHVVGKPEQHSTTDISVKLQAVLGNAMVNPTGDFAGAFAGALANPDIIEGDIVDDD